MNKLFFLPAITLLFLFPSIQTQSQNTTATCDKIWNDIVFGDCIGKNNSLLTFDYQADGTEELIASAGAFWYILKYNATKSEYKKVYVSQLFDKNIDKMALYDINDDSIEELILLINDRVIGINLTTLEVINSVKVPYFSAYWGHMRFGDANNDGVKEIVISNSSKLIFINKNTFEIEQTYNMTAGDFAIGNVDADPTLEIVFVHGLTVEVDTSGNMTSEYDFKPSNDVASGFIELSNIDSDPYLEAIVAHSWYTLVTYDIDINAPKYEISSDLDIDALTVQDINNDGIDEIIYGDGQWGKIHCHNSVTGDKIWEISNPSSGVTGIAFGDFDQDGTQEVSWGTGCSSSGADNLYIYKVENQSFEWKSRDINGPYFATKLVDVDEDGQDEIITISFKSESGYANGIITVYDATTKEIEFQSSGDLFNVLPDIYNIEVLDYGNDGDLDIIIAGREFYATIWVIDGNTYTIESTYNGSTDNILRFYALASGDIDADGTNEFVTSSHNKLHIYNSENFNLEWSSVSLESNSLPTSLQLGNVDNDAGEEIVLCLGYIYRFDDGTYTQHQTSYNGYSTMTLFDWDNSGDLEIIAGTQNGDIEIIDGSTLLAIDTLKISSEAIGGIAFWDLNGDGVKEIIATSGDYVYYVKKDGAYVRSQPLAAALGMYDGLDVSDYDNDGLANIILGSAYGVIELNASCAQCLWYDADIIKTDPSCGLDNGILLGASTDNTTVFSSNDQFFTTSLPQLPAGNYIVTATNDGGCKKEIPVELQQKILTTNLGWSDKSCLGPNDGSAFAVILEGTAPFSYLWSNGQSTDTITNLPTGDYAVTITDANNCSTIDTISIGQNSISTNLQIIKAACSGLPNGKASVNISAGQYPFTVEWDGTITNNYYNYSLSSGMHIVKITDAQGCQATQSFAIDSVPFAIKVLPLSSSCNDINTGAAQATIIEGTPPYLYQWSNGTYSDTLNAPAGNYNVTVVDGNKCKSINEVEILSTIQTTATTTDLLCFSDHNGAATVFATAGTPPYTYQWDIGIYTPTITNLSSGTYSVLIQDSMGCNTIKQIEINSPPALYIYLDITNDDLTTSTLEGTIIANVSGGVNPYEYSWNTGSTSQQISGLGEGDYTLNITDSNQCTSDTTIHLNLVSAITEIPNQILKLYPNPNDGHFNINYHGDQPIKEIRLLSMTGQSIRFDAKKLMQSSSIFVPNLTAGNYLLLFNIGDRYYFKKVLIEH